MSAQAAIDELTALRACATSWPSRTRATTLTWHGLKQLTDVDVIIGGDSHTLLGDFSAVGITAQSGAYPTVMPTSRVKPVCIGQAWEYSKAFGLMNRSLSMPTAT
jgi:2',3'-cyclic-nucleotide 2'-phosphodiesterase (5'-nucleotidase family)